MNNRKGRATGIFLALLVLVVGAGIFLVIDANSDSRGSSITANVVKTLRNCENVEIPYDITEEYEYFPRASVVNAHQEEKIEVFGKGIYQQGIVNLKNEDNEGGWFTVEFKWQTLNDQWIDRVRHYIEPDETIEFLSIYDTSLGEDTKFAYNSKAEPIIKTRTITKYRIEERCA